MSSLLNVFGSGVTCVSEDDSQWLAEVHSRKSGADYKLAAASFKVCCRGREYIVCSWQIPEPFWQSLRYSVPNPSIAVIFFFAWDKWACYADISRSACMSRDSVSVRKMLTGFYAFIFQGSHWSIQELLKNNLWIDSFYLHLDWSEREWLLCKDSMNDRQTASGTVMRLPTEMLLKQSRNLKTKQH